MAEAIEYVMYLDGVQRSSLQLNPNLIMAGSPNTGIIPRHRRKYQIVAPVDFDDFAWIKANVGLCSCGVNKSVDLINHFREFLFRSMKNLIVQPLLLALDNSLLEVHPLIRKLSKIDRFKKDLIAISNLS